jgi:hypothetical protein
VADIRSGQGYFDTASDLTRLAALYDEHAAVLAIDQRLHDAGDAAAARKNAETILRSLAEGRCADEQHWQAEVTRAWAALLTSYDEVRAAATWIYRADPQLKERFPSLFKVIRPGGGRPAAPEQPRPADTVTTA